MALINPFSLVNKTFILIDFMTSFMLGFMFTRETWARDISPFFNLVPADCSFYNSPQPSRRGGGIAVVMKKTFSFELKLIQLDWSEPVVLAILYRQPRSTNEFITDVSVT